MKVKKKAPARATKKKGALASAEIDPRFLPIVAAYAGDPRVVAGKMMASVGLKLDGKIFAMFVKGAFVAKLPKERVDAIVEAGHGERFDPRGDGRVMKEWVAIAGRESTWKKLAAEAYAFADA
jgi:hypothetical protein